MIAPKTGLLFHRTAFLRCRVYPYLSRFYLIAEELYRDQIPGRQQIVNVHTRHIAQDGDLLRTVCRLSTVPFYEQLAVAAVINYYHFLL